MPTRLPRNLGHERTDLTPQLRLRTSEVVSLPGEVQPRVREGEVLVAQAELDLVRVDPRGPDLIAAAAGREDRAADPFDGDHRIVRHRLPVEAPAVVGLVVRNDGDDALDEPRVGRADQERSFAATRGTGQDDAVDARLTTNEFDSALEVLERNVVEP